VPKWLEEVRLFLPAASVLFVPVMQLHVETQHQAALM
jgi:hypothetical protein